MTMTYGQLRDALDAAVTAAQPENDMGYSYVWIADFSDDTVTYEVGGGDILQEGYSLDDDGNITLAGSPVTVKSVTIYVPLEQEGALRTSMEQRGLKTGAPERRLRGQAKALDGVKSEPLTYHQHGRDSFFRDFLLTDRVKGAQERLDRHMTEMRVMAEDREKRAWSALHSGELGYERRVEPNRTDGTGGYFSPPAWLNELFATAKRPGLILGGLIPNRFPLPLGVSTINLPVISNGTTDNVMADNSPVPSSDLTDAAGTSFCASFAGNADVALQILELSPVGAGADFAIFTDLRESYDTDLEGQLLYGTGIANQQLPGVVPNATTAISYTDASPTGAEMWPFLAEAIAQLGDARDLPPEIWILRTARWAWIQGQTSTNGYPFGISPVYIGKDDVLTPNPIGGLMGVPVFLDDAISSTLGAGLNQDQAIALRPTDLMLFETAPMTAVMQEPGSAALTARVQMHGYAAAITRYTSSVATVSGTGFVVQSGY